LNWTAAPDLLTILNDSLWVRPMVQSGATTTGGTNATYGVSCVGSVGDREWKTQRFKQYACNNPSSSVATFCGYVVYNGARHGAGSTGRFCGESHMVDLGLAGGDFGGGGGHAKPTVIDHLQLRKPTICNGGLAYFPR
jgi:hypothetical protein